MSHDEDCPCFGDAVEHSDDCANCECRAHKSKERRSKMKTAEGRAKKKPIIIEFIRTSLAISLATNQWKQLPQWLRDAYEKGDVVFTPECVHIKTLEGDHRADPDDMIIQGVKGELYPCKPDIFLATYDIEQ